MTTISFLFPHVSTFSLLLASFFSNSEMKPMSAVKDFYLWVQTEQPDSNPETFVPSFVVSQGSTPRGLTSWESTISNSLNHCELPHYLFLSRSLPTSFTLLSFSLSLFYIYRFHKYSTFKGKERERERERNTCKISHNSSSRHLIILR